MKYVLLGYDIDRSLEELRPDDKRALHVGHRALHDEVEAEPDASLSVLAHYRFRPPRLVTTIRLGAVDVIRTEGPATEASKTLRALYLVESDDLDAVLDLAGQLPAVQMGGTVEVWPLIEPDPHVRRRHGRGNEPQGR